MRLFIAVCLSLGLTLTHLGAAAQDGETLRKELDLLRKQFETT